MFLDDEGTKLVYNRTGKTLELRDKRDNLLTSIPVSHFVSNIPTGIVVRNGKIKLMAGSEVIDENAISYNDLADKPDLNFAPANHTHNWNDIGGKPNNLATTDNIKTAIDGIQIGGRNYVLKSKEKQTLVGYVGKYWALSEPVVVGEQYTFSCYASVENGRRLSAYFIDIAGQQRQYIITDLVSGYNEISVIPKYTWGGLCAYHEVVGISPAPTATIEKLKFERGNKPTDWSPAPEDLANDRVGISIGDNQTYIVPKEQVNNTFYAKSNATIDCSQIPHLGSISTIKVYEGGQVTFTCSGKNIIYTTDNTFNGKKGSTAVVSIYENDCYIRISNV